ncbi:MAG: pyruvate kinase, partial [Runella sp.]
MIDKKTKIVATVGPASENSDTLYALAQAGVNVFRLNFSHGTHPDHLERIKRIRANNDAYGLSIGILQDLQGPKIRIGNVADKDGVPIVAGQKLVFTNDDIIGTSERVSTPYKGMYQDVKVGERI